MAEVFRNPGKVFRASMLPGEGSAQCILGDVSDGIVGWISVHFKNAGGFAGSVTPVARARNPEAAQPLTPPMPVGTLPFVPIPYQKLAAAGAGLVPAYANVALAAADVSPSAIILIPATGLSIALDITITAGELWVYWTPCIGTPPL